jgi:hypothetical protein
VPHAECTTSPAAPIVDGLIAGYQVFRVVYAAQASAQDYAGSPISREADALLGLAFTGLFLGSTIYGGVNTSRCRRLKEGPGPDEELTGISETTEPEPAIEPSQAAP